MFNHGAASNQTTPTTNGNSSSSNNNNRLSNKISSYYNDFYSSQNDYITKNMNQLGDANELGEPMVVTRNGGNTSLSNIKANQLAANEAARYVDEDEMYNYSQDEINYYNENLNPSRKPMSQQQRNMQLMADMNFNDVVIGDDLELDEEDQDDLNDDIEDDGLYDDDDENFDNEELSEVDEDGQLDDDDDEDDDQKDMLVRLKNYQMEQAAKISQLNERIAAAAAAASQQQQEAVGGSKVKEAKKKSKFAQIFSSSKKKKKTPEEPAPAPASSQKKGSEKSKPGVGAASPKTPKMSRRVIFADQCN